LYRAAIWAAAVKAFSEAIFLAEVWLTEFAASARFNF